MTGDEQGGTRVGYVGLGAMGGPMARNLVGAGHDVTVYDLDRAKVESLAADGATAAGSAEELARNVDILFTSLPGPRQAASAMPSLIDALSPGASWVDMTTNDRALLLELAQRAAARQISVLEAPVTGAIDGARRGELTIFAGGPEPVLDKLRPYLEALGSIIACGPLGTGNVVKLVTNQVWFVNAAAIGEALVLGKKAGVELTVLWNALKNSVGDTFVARHDVPSIFAGHYDPSFTLDLCCKDLGLIAGLIEQTGTETHITDVARERFEAARAAFGGDRAELLVCKLVEDASGVDLRVEGDWPRHWEA
jgi:3-hydroxyisobutyrate dehydrogenase-like beta-hydroxyacid dehydrogenase